MDPLHSILDHIEDAVIVTDKKGEIVFFNKAAITLSREALAGTLQVGGQLPDLAPESRKKLIRETLLSIQLEKKPIRTFAQYSNIEGHTFYLEESYTPLLNEHGDLQYIHTFIRDITPQKIFEQKLTALASNVSELVENANAIIIGVDIRGYITDWNRHCRHVTGYEKNEVYTRRFTEMLLKGPQLARFEELMSRVFNRIPMRNVELGIQTKSGKTLIFLLSCSVRTSANGQITGMMMVGQDVTELTEYKNSLEKKVEERTRELQAVLKKEKEVVEMKSRFVSIASHEFRAPLSSIQHAATYIKKHNQQIGQEELKDKLKNIEKQIKHMTHLLDDILTIGKNEAGKIQLVLSQVELKPFLEKIIEEVGHNTRQSHRVLLELQTDPGSIQIDEKLFRSVLVNLLTNAIKFSPGRDYVKLTVEGEGRHLIYRIQDQGIGIPPEERDKIFEPFLRGKGVTAIQGTGLGLSIVKKSVELLDGTLQLESEVGQGTTFIVTLPILEHAKTG